MSRTLKYFLKNLAKLALVCSAMFAYLYVATALITGFFDIEYGNAVFVSFALFASVFMIEMLWSNAKHRVQMENMDLIRKIKD